MGILLHGDAAFAGQGVVAETFDFSGLRGYKTGGTIHIVVNNQIGFTTSPHYSRSSPYPTDVAKMVMAPIFHVNGDDPEATVHVARIAAEFRQEFNVDVVIDMICYRRFGHNEGDEPRFTQPLMYDKIGDHKTTRELYAEKLVKDGTLTKEEADKVLEDENAYLAKEFEAGLSYKPNKADWLEGKWSGLKVASGEARRGSTGVAIKELKRIGAKLCEVPETFNLNSKLKRFISSRQKAIEYRRGHRLVDRRGARFRHPALRKASWSACPARTASGGTFSQRHSVYIDQKTEERYVPLNNIQDKQSHYEVIDSPLSEAGVLGFEYGYSQAEPERADLLGRPSSATSPTAPRSSWTSSSPPVRRSGCACPVW